MTDAIYNAIGWTLLHAIWQISLVAIVLYLLLNAHWLKSASGRYLALASSVFIIAFVAGITFVYYYSLQAPADPKLSTAGTDQIANASISSSTPLLMLWVQWLSKNMNYFTMAWIAGFIVYLLKFLGGLIYIGYLRNSATEMTDPLVLQRFRQLSSQAAKRPIRLYLSEKILSPLTFGIYRTSIVLPLAIINQLSIEDTEIILAHEIAHIIRHDFLVNLFVSLVKTVFYYHPAIWWLTRQLEMEREKATDQLACGLCSIDALQYAKTLLKTQELRQQNDTISSYSRYAQTVPIPLWRSKKQLLIRVEHLLGRQNTKNQWIPKLITFFLFAGIFSLLSFTQIILPRNGQMVHPAIQVEAESQETEIEVTVTKNTLAGNDSTSIEVVIVREQKPAHLKPGDKNSPAKVTVIDTTLIRYPSIVPPIEKKEDFKEKSPVRDNAINTLEEYTLVPLHPSVIEKTPIHKKIEKRFEWHEYNEFELPDSMGKKIIIELKEANDVSFWERSGKSLLPTDSLILYFDQLNRSPFIEKNVERFQRLAEQEKLFEQMQILKQPIYELDSIIYRYKFDKAFLDNLKMEGLHHIEEFRHQYSPVDEQQMMNIIYIEKG